MYFMIPVLLAALLLASDAPVAPGIEPAKPPLTEQDYRNAMLIVERAYTFSHRSAVAEEVTSSTRSEESSFQQDQLRIMYERQREEAIKVFFTPEGAAWVAAAIRPQTNQDTILAMLEVLHESKQPIALSVFQDFQQSENKVVAKSAANYLTKRSPKK